MLWMVVLDPLEGLLTRTDTSLALINKARSRKITVETATLDRLFFDGKARVIATAEDGSERCRSMADYSLIFMRKEPPYDLSFHYATQLLALSGTLVVNSPQALQGYNEKLIALQFPELMPPTLVSSKPKLLAEFNTVHQQAVLKALDSFQGKSVVRLSDEPRKELQEATNSGKEPVMVQKFLDTVYEGDKRVIMLGKEVLGAVMRRPKQGYHANFAKSEALRTTLSEKEQAAVAKLGPWMLEMGIHFSGLDFIGGNLTEINITCPTGIVQISELEGRDLAAEMVDYFIDLTGKK